MRAIVVAVCLGGCSYTSPGATDHPAVDALVSLDALPDVAASNDASAACLAAATKTSPMGHHYFATDDLDFNGAKTACGGSGGHLVKIEDAAEDNFISQQFGLNGLNANGFAWIGLSDPTSTDVYVWTDLTPLVTFNAFPNGTPPASSNDCIDSGGGTWAVFNCTFNNHGGICECE